MGMIGGPGYGAALAAMPPQATTEPQGAAQDDDPGYDARKDPVWSALPVTHEGDNAEWISNLKPADRAKVLQLMLTHATHHAKHAVAASKRT